MFGIGVGVTDLPVLQHTGGGTPTPTASITPPVLSIPTANNVYPPQVDAALDDSVLVGDTLYLDWSHDPTFTTGVTEATNTIDSTEAGAHAASFTGLSSISSGTNRFKAWIVRGGLRSYDSNIATHGPDDLAPVLSSPVATKTGSSTATVGATTDTGEGTIYIVLTLTNSQPSKAQIKAGQNSAGAAAAKTGTISPVTTGAKTANLTGLTASTTYYTWLMHEDVAGNQSNVVGASAITTDVVSATWNSADKDALVTLSNANLRATGTGGVGAPQLCYATDAITSGIHTFTVTVTTLPSAGFIVGVSDHNRTSRFGFPGRDNSFGICHADTGEVYVNTGSPTSSASHFGLGDVMKVVVDAGAGTTSFYKNNVLSYTVTKTLAEYYPFVGPFQDQALTADFSAW